MSEKLYRPCWIKNGKSKCFYSCYTIEKTDDILTEKKKKNDELNMLIKKANYELKTMVMPCNSFLPEFIDKIRSEYQAQKIYEKFFFNKNI